MEMLCSLTAVLAVLAALLFYVWMRHRYAYWARRGVYFIKPVPIAGTMLSTVLQRESFFELSRKQYAELKPHRIGGLFAFLTPSLMITDPDLIREITVKHFDHFSDRRSITNEKADPMMTRSLVSLKGHEWREMRNLLSPAFTTSKLRAMFPLISRCGQQFARFLMARPLAKSEPLELKSTFNRLTNDVIATVAFGVECNAVNNPEEKFYKFGQRIMDFTGLRLLIAFAYTLFPKLMEILSVPLIPREVTEFFRDIILKTKVYRDENSISRPDMLQLLMAAQKDGIERGHGDEHDVGTLGESEDAADLHRSHLAPEKQAKKAISDDDVAAQAFLFFSAGFETVSVLLSFLAHELAVNPDIQERLRSEVDDAILENDGKLTYESVLNMKYLDMVVSETLRKHPPGGFTDRNCTKDFKIPNTEIVIEKGMSIMLPLFALQRDPEYFPDPERFDPERFNNENKNKIKAYTFLPFGSGPHNCIGMRLALLEVKVCMAYVMSACKLDVCSKTEIPIQLSRKSIQMITDAGFWLNCVPRDEPSVELDT